MQSDWFSALAASPAQETHSTIILTNSKQSQNKTFTEPLNVTNFLIKDCLFDKCLIGRLARQSKDACLLRCEVLSQIIEEVLTSETTFPESFYTFLGSGFQGPKYHHTYLWSCDQPTWPHPLQSALNFNQFALKMCERFKRRLLTAIY